jgi:DNA invertase Pin-like site-specific DNA recombinase
VKTGTTKPVRCAIYTRVSTEHGLEQDFNSLDAQHEAAQAYIRSQAHAGWTLIRRRYDDGGFSPRHIPTLPKVPFRRPQCRVR